MRIKEKMVTMPLIKHPMLYFFMVMGFLSILTTPILSFTSRPDLVLLVYLGLFLLFSVTVGFEEIGPFYNKSSGIINLIGMTGTVYITCILVENLTGYFLAANDPQLLDQYSYELSWQYVLNHFSRYCLVGIGEELFKFCVFLFVYWFGVKISGKKLISCIISVLLTSLLFGLLHVNYNYSQWLNITLIIGMSSVVYFYFLFKYQTILPLMIAHGLQDFIVSLELTQELEGIHFQFLMLLIGVWLISRFGFGMEIKMQR